MSLFSKIFSSKPRSESKSPAEVYAELRQMILTKRPPQFSGFWGVVMDMGMPNGTATMIAVADGTISLYTSTGGGIIGLGPHEGPRRAASVLLEVAPQFSEHCRPVTEYPLPRPGNTRVYLMGPDVTSTAEANSGELGSGTHVLSPLFFKCHALLTEMRTVDANLRSPQANNVSKPQ